MTGLTVPVAVTDRTIGPSVTSAVTILGAVVLPPKKNQTPATTTIAAIASIHALFFMLDNFMGSAQLLSRCSSLSNEKRKTKNGKRKTKNGLSPLRRNAAAEVSSRFIAMAEQQPPPLTGIKVVDLTRYFAGP